KVILNMWTISLRRENKFRPPKMQKSTFPHFLLDKELQGKIRVFGEKILDYSLSLCQGNYDYLDRLQDDLLLKIISFLQLKDRFVLAQLSKRFKMLCNSEKFWELIVKNDCPNYNPELEDLAKQPFMENYIWLNRQKRKHKCQRALWVFEYRTIE
uniref:F-box protein 36a n=1 Tax=Poecilia reticulata TaxID=8081 RepID=A0A3P9PYG8_POERE